MEILVAIVLGALVLFLVALFNTFVLSQLWVWYITPAFNIQCPKLYVLYGLVLTVGFFSSGMTKTENKSIPDQISASLSKGIVILLFGWAVQAIFA